METLIMGGSEQTVPTHARVIMFGLPPASVQVRRTTGTGYSAVDGFNIFRAMTTPTKTGVVTH
jgi:hypothetical protein